MANHGNSFWASVNVLVLTIVMMTTAAYEPCRLHQIETVRPFMTRIISAMQLSSTRSVDDFHVDSRSHQGFLEVRNARSFCFRARQSSARADRQFCRESMRLNVDLSREPAVVFEAFCHSSLVRSQHVCPGFPDARNYTCDTRHSVVMVRNRLCRKQGQRILSDVLQKSFLWVGAGCPLKCMAERGCGTARV